MAWMQQTAWSNVCGSVIFVNENENENYQKRKNNDSVDEN